MTSSRHAWLVAGTLALAVAACGGTVETFPTTTTGTSTGTGGTGTGGGGSNTGGTTGSTSSTSTSSTGTGGSAPVDHGPGASALVSGGEVCKSPSYQMVITVGQSTQNQTKTTSPTYQMQGGLIGALETLK